MRGPLTLLKEAIAHFWVNKKLFATIYAAPAFLTLIVAYTEPVVDGGVISTAQWMTYILLLFFLIAVNILMGIAMTFAIANPALTTKQAYMGATGYFWKYLGLAFLAGIIVTVSFLLLIIPGIIVSTWLVFIYFVLLFEQRGIIDSLKQSREYVRGRWWKVFGRVVVLIFVSILFGIVLGLVLELLSAVLPEILIVLL